MASSDLTAPLQAALAAVKDPNTGQDFVSTKALKNLQAEGGKVSFDIELGYPARSQHAALRQALVGNEFVLHYQPKVHMGSGQVVGVEALIRWRHPERGVIAPGEFIDLAKIIRGEKALAWNAAHDIAVTIA